MSDNPFFSPNISTDEIYLGQDVTICLTEEVNGKSNIDHTHTGYAQASHTHNEYSPVAHDHDEDYASINHTHNYNDLSNAPTSLPANGGNADTVDNKHASDFADASHTHTEITAKYEKPSTGIPKTDLASDVQSSLGKADSALQSYTETDPTVPAWAKATTKPTYTASEVGAMPAVSVSTADNGKFLCVVNGAWAATAVTDGDEVSY